jgi:hypothetical protein
MAVRVSVESRGAPRSAKRQLGQWIQDRELRAHMRAPNDLDDVWLRARTRRLVPLALKALGRILDSPNTPWRAKAWAITTVLRLNRYWDEVMGLVGPRASTASRNVVELNGLPRRGVDGGCVISATQGQRYRLFSRCRGERRTEGVRRGTSHAIAILGAVSSRSFSNPFWGVSMRLTVYDQAFFQTSILGGSFDVRQ